MLSNRQDPIDIGLANLLVRASLYSGLLFFLAFAGTALFPLLPWFVIIPAGLPVIFTGVLMMLNHRRISRSASGFLFGLGIVSTAVGCMAGVSATYLQQPLPQIASALKAIGIILLFGPTFSTLFALNYYNTAFAWRIQGERALPKLLELLQDGSLLVRQDQAAHILGKLADPRAVEPLIVALQDESDSLRADAARALGRIGDERALPALLRMQVTETGKDDNGRPIKKIAAEAISRIEARRRR